MAIKLTHTVLVIINSFRPRKEMCDGLFIMNFSRHVICFLNYYILSELTKEIWPPQCLLPHYTQLI